MLTLTYLLGGFDWADSELVLSFDWSESTVTPCGWSEDLAVASDWVALVATAFDWLGFAATACDWLGLAAAACDWLEVSVPLDVSAAAVVAVDAMLVILVRDRSSHRKEARRQWRPRKFLFFIKSDNDI